MKGVCIVLLVLLVAAACVREDTHNDSTRISDSTRLISSPRDLEKVVRDYYVSVERDVRTDLGVSDAEITDHVQSLINDGYVKEPVIFVITDDGPAWKTVDYPTYKQFMSDYAVASRRFHGISPKIGDSVVLDSIRSELLKAFKAENVDLD